MTTIGDLLTRDLSRKIEEIIQADQADEQSVYAEITEYVATDSIREQYHDLLKAVVEAPSDPNETVGEGAVRPRHSVRRRRPSVPHRKYRVADGARSSVRPTLPDDGRTMLNRPLRRRTFPARNASSPTQLSRA